MMEAGETGGGGGAKKKKVSASEEAEERNYQLIENLMTRLHRMEYKAAERRKACEDDQNANSDLCSSKVPSLMQDMDLQNDGPTQRKASMFLLGHDHGTMPEINVTFRSAAATEAGRRLDAKFEDEVGYMFAPTKKHHRAGGGANTTNKAQRGGGNVAGGAAANCILMPGGGARGRRALDHHHHHHHHHQQPQPQQQQQHHQQQQQQQPGGGGGAALRARRTEQHKQEEKKQERIKFERRLQSNLEQYVTRAVSELRYRLPKSRPSDQSASSSTRSLLMLQGGALDRSGDGPPFPLDGARGDEDEDGEPPPGEQWPIPLAPHEMNPRLLLAYSTERVVLPAGAKMFKHFVLNELSCDLYVYLYWFVHCRFYQEHSVREQEHLLDTVATLYVQMLSIKALEAHADVFFKYYPYVVANAIYWGFFYLCPGSRHLYTNGFRRVLYLAIVQLMSGLDVCPSSILVLQRRIYPDFIEADDDTDKNADGLPPLPHASNKASSSSALDAAAAAAANNNNANNKNNNKKKNPAPEDLLGAAGAAPSHAGAAAAAAAGESTTKSLRWKKHHATDDPENGTHYHNSSASSLHSIATTSLLAAKVTGHLKTAKQLGGRRSQSQPDLRLVHQAPSLRRLLQNPESHQEHTTLASYTGSRSDLRFRKPLPEKLESAIPRQRRTAFDTSRVSPLLDHYLRSHSPKKQNRVCRTDPVHWCYTGGTETFIKTPSRKDVHESIAHAYSDAKQAYKRDVQQLREKTKTSLRSLENEQRKIERGGSVAIGRYALDRVVENMKNTKEGLRTKQSGRHPSAAM